MYNLFIEGQFDSATMKGRVDQEWIKPTDPNCFIEAIYYIKQRRDSMALMLKRLWLHPSLMVPKVKNVIGVLPGERI